jgi:sugar phosphate isomerase/epimerase
VALEPLNASIVNVETAIWTLEQAMGVVEAVDRPNFGICLDVWNVWQNAEIAAGIRACGAAGRVFVVQVSDWRTPRSYQDRLIPGRGEIPLPGLLRAIHEGGYRGPYVVEIFSSGVPDALWEQDLEGVIRDSRAGMDRAWAAAFAGG